MSTKRTGKSRRSSVQRQQRRRRGQNQRRDGGRSKENLSFEQLEARHLLATFLVNSNADLPVDLTDSVVTLRDAIQAANDDVAVSPGGAVGNGDDTITFDSNVFTGGNASLIRLTQGELVTTETLTIDGSTGVDVTITGDANGDDVVDSGNVTDVSASFGGTIGAADDLLDDNSRVLNSSGSLTLERLTITGGRTVDPADGSSSATTSGGGIRGGVVTLVDSTISGNSAYGENATGGGIHTPVGSIALIGSTVNGNSAAVGGGIFSVGDLFITNSTVSGNRATGSGGGIAHVGIGFGGFSLMNTTVTDNEARYGGGLYLGIVNFNASVSNSIIAGNRATNYGPDFSFGHKADTVEVSHSLVGVRSGALVFSSSQFGTTADPIDPLLGPLADNGGPTMTHALLRESPAMDAGDPAFDVNGPDGIAGTDDDVLFDQRGTGFDRVVGNGIDIGSFEREAPAFSFVPSDVSVLFETLSNVDLSTLEVAAGSGGAVTLTLTASSGVFESPSAGEGVSASLSGPQTVTLVGTPLALTSYFDDLSNIQYTAAAGLFGEGAATLTVAVDSVTVGVTNINVAEIPTLIVNTAADADNPFDDLTSLREAIAFANSSDRPGADTITFDGSVFPGGNASVIRLTQGELEITESLSIDASGVGGVTITGDANGDDVVDAANITDINASFLGEVGGPADLLDDNSRVFEFDGTGDFAVDSLVVTGGRTYRPLYGGSGFDGGGIHGPFSGQTTLVNTVVSGNIALGSSVDGGGVSARNLTLIDSTVSNNSAGDTGGGISSSILTLTNSTVSGNASQRSGGGISAREATLINSVVSGNSAAGRGGGIRVFDAVTLINSEVSGNSTTGDRGHGGGIYTQDGVVSLSNSTVSGNRTLGTDSHGGGIFTYGGFSSGLISVRNSTITANEASGLGGGIYTDADNNSFITIENSIVAGNTDSGTAPDLSREPNGGLQINHSLIGAAGELGFIAGDVGNQIGSVGNPIDPLLGPLADNGGPTMTHALLPGSPAINTGDPAFDIDGFDGIAGTEDDIQFDQRGTGFDRVVGGRLDIGAFESSQGPSRLIVTIPDDITADDGEISLREAIAFANSAESPGADTITFAQSFLAGGANSLIRLTQGELVITETLTIDGSTGLGVTITGDASGDDFTLAGNVTDAVVSFGSGLAGGEPLLDDNSRVIHFANEVGDLTLEGLTITGGHTSGLLTGGGGVFFESDGELILRRSLVSGNSTSGFVANGGGIYSYFGQLTLANSTVSDNATFGLGSNGGGILTGTGSAILMNSTVSRNQASGVGGGLFVFNSGESPTLTIENSIVAGNTDDGTAPDLRPSPIGTLEINHSLIGAADNLGLIGGNVGNQLGTFVSPIDPLLGPLADNGGPTMTLALLQGSPAIDSADPNFNTNGPDGIAGTDDDATFDQRGFGFDRVVEGRLDVGAFEFVPDRAPTVVEARIDEGGVLARPDLWRTLTVEFDRDVSITADALSLVNDTLGGTVVDVSHAIFDYDSSTFTATWTFDVANPLPFAFYTYSLDASLITVGAFQLDGDGDGTAGDDFVEEHYIALPGDANLDGRVDVLVDGFAMVANLGFDIRGWANGDFNGDGTVNVLGDAFPLVAFLGRSVIPPVTSASSLLARATTTPVASSTLAVSPIEVGQEDDEDQVGVQPTKIEPTSSLELAGHQSRDLAFESDLSSDFFVA